jgi:hypothetical protein
MEQNLAKFLSAKNLPLNACHQKNLLPKNLALKQISEFIMQASAYLTEILGGGAHAT